MADTQTEEVLEHDRIGEPPVKKVINNKKAEKKVAEKKKPKKG